MINTVRVNEWLEVISYDYLGSDLVDTEVLKLKYVIHHIPMFLRWDLASLHHCLQRVFFRWWAMLLGRWCWWALSFERASPVLHHVLTLPKRTAAKPILWFIAQLH